MADATPVSERPSETFQLELPYTRSLGPVIGAFLTALRDGRLVGVRTPSGRVLCPPLEYDPVTSESCTEVVDLPSTGAVQTWSWVPEPMRKHPLDRPFAFATVRVDGADTDLVTAVDTGGDRAALHRGMRVTARFREERTGHPRDLECFVPDA